MAARDRYAPRPAFRPAPLPSGAAVGCSRLDLYKAAYKLGPFVPSELLGDCFELAADIRELDMRASPYDLSEYGYSPVPVETAEGRATYMRKQTEFSQRAAPLRERLIQHCRILLELHDRVK